MPNSNPYIFHGFPLEYTSTQCRGNCPFCGKSNHFFTSDPQKHDCTPPNFAWGWGCKSCGLRGNLTDFLKRYLDIAETLAPRPALEAHQMALEARKLSEATVARFNLKPSQNGRMLIPAYNPQGGLSNLYRVVWSGSKEGELVMGTPTLKHPLLFVSHLSSDPAKPVWVCEGHWDALRLSQLAPKADVVGVPGATWDKRWSEHLQGRDTYLLFDNDEAGDTSTARAISSLESGPKSLAFLNWSKVAEEVGDLPDKFDVSDLIDKTGAGKAFSLLHICLEKQKLFDSCPIYKVIAGIEFDPCKITELKDTTIPVSWPWYGFIGRTLTTALVAYAKVGKTTLITEILRLFCTGGALCTPVEKCRALVVSEESKSVWIDRCEKQGLTDNIHMLCRPVKGCPDHKQWKNLVDVACQYCVHNKIDVVIFDTYSRFNPAEDENATRPMMNGLTILEQFHEHNMAVVIVHHARKMEASEGRAARGSSSFVGHVDIVMEYNKVKNATQQDRRRQLTMLSRRDKETPPQLTIEMTQEGHFISLGTNKQADVTERLTRVQQILLEKGQPMTAEEIIKAYPDIYGPRTAKDDLKTWTKSGKVNRQGKGVRGSRYLYSIKE